MAEKRMGKNLNLTEGNPLKLILLFAIPVFLGRLFQMTYSLVDTKIVGSILGEQALAAVGSVSTLYNLLTGIFSGFTLGFSILIAQNFGAGEEQTLKKNVASSIVLGMATAVVIIFGVVLFLNPILKVMNVPDAQLVMAHDYILILVWGMFITLWYNLCADMLRAIGDSVTPLIFLILATVINIILDYAFIGALGLGVAGAGYATVLSQFLSAVLCLLRIKRSFPVLHIAKEHFLFEKERMGLLYKNGLAMALMSSLVNCGTVILQTGINRLGTNIIVAHTAARKVFEIFSLPVSVFGASMATYCGQNYGAGKYDRIRQGLKAVLGIGCVFSIIIFILSHTISPYLISFIASSDNEEVIYWGTKYLEYDMSFQVVCVFIVILRNSLQGIGDQRTPVFSSFIELAGKIVFTVVFVRFFGYWAVIWTEPVIWICMVIPLLVTAFKNPVLFGKKKETDSGNSLSNYGR